MESQVEFLKIGDTGARLFAYRNHPVARERMEKTEEVTTGAKPLRRKRNGIQIDCGGSGFCPDEGPWPT